MKTQMKADLDATLAATKKARKDKFSVDPKPPTMFLVGGFIMQYIMCYTD